MPDLIIFGFGFAVCAVVGTALSILIANREPAAAGGDSAAEPARESARGRE